MWDRMTYLAIFVAISPNGIICQDYAKCTVKLDVSSCSSNNNTVKKCDIDAMPQVCRKMFNISYIELKPYSSEIVGDLVRTCCGPCVNYTEVNTLTKVSDVSEAVMKESHFIFPVLGRATTSKLYGYQFIPIIETPNVYYITMERTHVLQELVVSCLEMWPLLIICVLMVAISGFICWLTETWGNREEFPRTFLRGWFEGIWWSFISMTTVGYGDKAPKSIPARLFSIIWIVVGITTFSLVTAMLTSEISTANNLPPPKIEGANVGVIRHRDYEAILIASKGGILVDINPVNVTEGIRQLIRLMQKKEIDGFVLDRYTLMLFYNFFKEHPRYKYDIDYLRKYGQLTEVVHSEKFLYGILVKNAEDFAYLEDFMMSNRDVINTCNSLFLNIYSRRVQIKKDIPSLFSTKGQMFWPTFIACLSIIAALFVFGAVYRVQFNKRKGKKDGNNSKDKDVTKVFMGKGGGAPTPYTENNL